MPTRAPSRAATTRARPAANPFLALLATVKSTVDTRLSELFSEHVERTRDLAPEVRTVLDATRDLTLRGGKRLRAGLVVAGHQVATESDAWDAPLQAGVALELLQSYFLIHDDWMDEDETRRGGPAVHAALRKAFRAQHRGDSAAILAGDYAAAMATEVIGSLDVPPKRLPAILACFVKMQSDAVLGQQLDVIAKDPDIETTYRLKTASYTLEGPLVLGALIGGAGAAVVEALRRFAIPVGVAFQLRDDLLGAFSKEKVTGKPSGSDVKAGKRTLLVELALRHGSAAERKAVRAALGNPRAGARQVQLAIAALESSGARDRVEQRARKLVADAVEQLGKERLRHDGRVLLEAAALAVTERGA